MKRRYFIYAATLMTTLLTVTLGRAADIKPPEPRVFGGAQVQEVYRVLLDRDDLLRESVMDIIKQKNIQDGLVLIMTASLTPLIARGFGWSTSFLVAAVLGVVGASAWLAVDPKKRLLERQSEKPWATLAAQ